MTIAAVNKIKSDTTTVVFFIVREGESVLRHPCFGFFSKEDQHYIASFEKKTPIREGHSHILFTPSGRGAVLLGVASASTWNHRKALLTARRVIAFARREKMRHVAVHFDDFIADGAVSREVYPELLATQFEMANFEFTRYKTPPPEGWIFVERISIIGDVSAMREGLRAGSIIGEEINKARILSNTPAMDLTPRSFADEARALGKEFGFRVSVLGEQEMKKLGMGGILGVGKGSVHKPQFVIAEYSPKGAGAETTVLVGKGVTFDAGGLNLKPTSGLHEMHMDMSGGAAVLHVVAMFARLKIRQKIVGLIPVVENMLSGSSYHPGDLLKTMSGKTIEVMNTDAEGRIILADALTYAKRYAPRLLIDVATLTGAAEVALGQRASAIFTSDAVSEQLLRDAGEATGDFVWPFPLWEEYESDIKGTFGDLANQGKTRFGGAITGAVFLWQFVKGDRTPSAARKPLHEAPIWIHIDIAPRMVAIEGEFLAQGAAGASMGLLSYFLRRR
jgi:leucyl aminopeptidase